MKDYRKIKKPPKHIILTIITVVWILIIWGNSFTPASISGNESDSVLRFVTLLLNKIGLNIEIPSLLIRKIAHFSEFGVFGVILYNTIKSFQSYYDKKSKTHIFIPLFFGLIVATADETIQIFSNGRVAMVTDILIDYAGFLTGLFFANLLIYLAGKRRLRKLKKSKAKFAETLLK